MYKLKCIMIIFLLFLAVIWAPFRNPELHTRKIYEISQKIMDNSLFQPHFQNLSIRYGNGSIKISLAANQSFAQASQTEQFSLLSIFHTQLRFLMKYNQPSLPYYTNDIELTVSDGKKSYSYYDSNPHKTQLHMPKGIMEIDQKKVLTSSEVNDFSHLHTAYYDDRTSNAYLERDVHSYISNLYEVMTKNGSDYHSKKDSRLITEAAKERFQLDEHEVQSIYNKWFLFLE